MRDLAAQFKRFCTACPVMVNEPGQFPACTNGLNVAVTVTFRVCSTNEGSGHSAVEAPEHANGVTVVSGDEHEQLPTALTVRFTFCDASPDASSCATAVMPPVSTAVIWFCEPYETAALAAFEA